MLIAMFKKKVMLIVPGAITVVKKLTFFLSRSISLVDNRWSEVDESFKNKLSNPSEWVNPSSFSPFTRRHGGGKRGGRGGSMVRPSDLACCRT